MPKNSKIPSIYISYAWNPQSEKIVESIEKKLGTSGAKIIRDKTNLKYKGRIKDFMEEIGLGKYIIVVISNKYLRSENCMFELLQIFKNDDFYERIFPLVLDEVKIAKASGRLELLKYWENETKDLDKKIRGLKELSNIQGVADDLNLYSEIRNNIARLTNILKDINTLNVDKHISSDFQQLYISLTNKISTDYRKNTVLGINKKIVGRALAVTLTALTLLVGYEFFKGDGHRLTGGSSQRETPSTSAMSTESDYYSVKLRVDATMKDENVFVDNEPATVLERGDAYIFIRLLRKEGPYRFEVKSIARFCLVERAIEKDSIELVMECKENAIAVQYYTVKLMVDTFMTDGKVYVDNRPADIVTRGGTYITVKVKKRNSSYLFEVKNEIGSCEAEQVIEKNATEVVMSC